MTTTATPSAALVVAESVCSVPERLVLVGFLAGYGGLTPEAYALHRQECLRPAGRAEALADGRSRHSCTRQPGRRHQS
jgi:hypothetical protein